MRQRGDHEEHRDILCSRHTTAMSGRLLLPLCLQILMVTIILACPPREYKINGICCPMCDKGSFVKAHCTRELSSSVCVLCADTTYMDHPNGLPECFRCKECDRRVNLIVKQECTASSNTICGCSSGHFCTTPDCDMCQEHKVCQPGERIKEPGSPKTDTVCEECSPGHFSNHTNAAKCSPWKDCSESGYILDKEGNLTTDSTCKEKRSRIAAITAAAAFVSTILAVILFVCTYPVFKPERNEQKIMQEESARVSEPEDGTKQSIPESSA